MTGPDHPPADPLPGATPLPLAPDTLGAPRLRILHIMFWTACTAAVLVLMQLQGKLSDSPINLNADEAPLAMALRLLMAMGHGVGIGILLLIPIWRLGRHRTPAYPGDWLLVVTAVWMLVSVLFPLGLWFADWMLKTWGIDEGLRGYFMLNAFAQVVGLASCLLAVIFVKQLGWRCFFACFVVLHLFTLAHSMYGLIVDWEFRGNWLEGILRAIYWRGGILFAVPVLLLVIVDLKRGRRFPWTHWLGVGIFMWYRGTTMLQSIWVDQAIRKLNGED